MTSYISEIISAILGFISGGFTVGIFMHIKDNRISSKHQGNNIASSGGVAAGNVQGNIVINSNSQPVDSTSVLSPEAKRILKELYPDTKIRFNFQTCEVLAFSETRSERPISCPNYSCTEEALNELESFQYLKKEKSTSHRTIYQLTALGRSATAEIIK